MTFEYLWGSFIDVLKFQSEFENRKTAIERYQVLRTEYIKILKKLGINKILIITHAYYKIENIGNADFKRLLEFDEIIKEANEKDKLSVFDFPEILNTVNDVELNKDFKDQSDLEIMLLDYF